MSSAFRSQMPSTGPTMPLMLTPSTTTLLLLLLWLSRWSTAIKCYTTYRFLEGELGKNVSELRKTNCSNTTTACGDAVVSLTRNRKQIYGENPDLVNASVKPVTLSVKYCDDNDVDICAALESRVKTMNWTNFRCASATCVTDYCNALVCYQPKLKCLNKLKKQNKATLRNVAACESEPRECQILDASSCVTVRVKLSGDIINLRGCHRKGQQTFCQKILARHRDDVFCRESFCVTDSCNKPEVASIGLIAIIVGVVLAGGGVIICLFVIKNTCCEPTDEPRNRRSSESTVGTKNEELALLTTNQNHDDAFDDDVVSDFD